MKTAVLFIYVISLVIIGFIGMRKTKDLNDFFLGGREIGPWMSAFAYGTTYFSAVIFIGYAGKVGWGFGLSGLWIAICNSLIGGYLAWRILAKPTREITQKLNVRTMPEFLAVRYNSPGFKIFSSIVIFIFLVPYSASVYMGLSYLFESVFHIKYVLALAVMAVLTALYLVMGGYFAVNLSNVFQGFVMIFGIILMVTKIVSHQQIGGIVEGLKKLYEIDPKLVSPVGPPGFWPLFFLAVLTSLGPWGLPQMIHKFYSIKDVKSVKPAMLVTTGFSLVISLGAYFIGSLTRLFFTSIPLEAGKPNPDLMIPQIIDITMPEALAAVILALIMSASMSTLSSLVLVSSSAVGIDLVQGYLKPDLDKRYQVLLMRILCLIFIGLSLAIALLKPAVILTLMAISWGTVAGVFLSPYLFGLFWKGTTKIGAWTGSLSGLAISLGLSIISGFDSSKIPMYGTLAMVIPMGIVPLVSIITPAFSSKHISQIFDIGEELPEKSLAAKNL